MQGFQFFQEFRLPFALMVVNTHIEHVQERHGETTPVRTMWKQWTHLHAAVV